MRHDDPLPLRAYRRALFILPRRFRQRYAANMATMLADEWRERRGIACAALLGSALLDLLWTAAIERIGGSGERHDKGAGMTSSRALGISWLDFKLGFRMLVKYPGLTLVGGFAMAFAIWFGAATFELVAQVLRPTLPLDEGDRIVEIRNWDAAGAEPEYQSLHDVVTWREELESVEDVGAFRTIERNLITEDGESRPVPVAAISASAFRLVRVAPLLGRSLVEADEQAGAPPVVVIGHGVWQRRLGSDPDVVGRTVRLGSSETTVVGVMPEGFAFPVSHSLWAPLRLNPLDYERGERPAIRVFGRLAPGAALEDAQAELTTMGARLAADFPATHAQLRPQVMPYPILDVPAIEAVGIRLVNAFALMLLVLVCANIALLMFARAATRESEMVVRSALGASRGRIITQLFAEALVLGGVAGAVGLAAAAFGLRWWLSALDAQVEGGLPFWWSDSLSPSTVLYATLLTIVGAAVSGVVPALKVTARRAGARLRQVSVGGGGLRFGGVWTAVIVTQVAVTVAFPVLVFFVQREAARVRSLDVGLQTEEYLSVRLELDRELARGASADTSRAEFLVRFGATYQELERRLAAEPGVAGTTFASRLPGASHPLREVEVDGGAAASEPPGHRVGAASVDVDYFDVLDAPILSGRGFHSGDVESDRVVIVNQSFVERVLGGRNPIGRRVRYLPGDPDEPRSPEKEAGPWYEIVGVVRDLGMTNGADPTQGAGFYHPVAPGAANPLRVAVHVMGEPASFTSRLRSLATAVDPRLRLYELTPLDEIQQVNLRFFWSVLTGLVSSVALLLSLAGIYAVTSFTVSRRTREIGIRTALGGDPRRIVLAIFRRPLAQVGVGVVAGGGLAGAMLLADSRGEVSAIGVMAVVAYAALMMGVCMLACVLPTRRALGVEPTEALRADG